MLLDGVGFSENTRGTITPLLENCTDFVQMSTLFKFGLRLHSLGLCKIEAIKFLDPYDSEDIQILVKKYVPDDVTVVYEVRDPVSGEIMDNTYYSTNYTEINAGRALLYIDANNPLSGRHTG